MRFDIARKRLYVRLSRFLYAEPNVLLIPIKLGIWPQALVLRGGQKTHTYDK